MRFHLLRSRNYIFHMISEVAIYHRWTIHIKRWNLHMHIFPSFRDSLNVFFFVRNFPCRIIHLLYLWFDASLLFTFRLILWVTTQTICYSVNKTVRFMSVIHWNGYAELPSGFLFHSILTSSSTVSKVLVHFSLFHTFFPLVSLAMKSISTPFALV